MLPPRVKNMIKSHRHLSHQRHMDIVKSNIASSSNIVRHSAARQVDEPGPIEGRAVDKVLSTPLYGTDEA